jgi:hypothetical protein
MAELNILLKLKYSFYSALVFFLVANPETYMLTQKIFGGFLTIASTSGCPTTPGFFLHTLVFFIVMAAMMMFPRDK